MPEEVNNITKPAGVPSTNTMDDFVVHVMPREFYGDAAKMHQTPEAKPMPTAPVGAPKPAPVPIPASVRAGSVVKTAVAGPVPPTPKKRSKKSLIILVVGVVVLAVIGGGAYFYRSSLPSGQVPVVVTPEPPVVEPPVVEPPSVTTPQPGVDTDSDGLTDAEERLYGTDFRNPDTDGDSFLDGNEVFHRFDPLGFAPSTLLDTGSVDVFTSLNLTPGFDVYYPMAWPNPSAGIETVTGAVFATDSTARMLVDVQRKAEGQTFQDWYAATVVNLTGTLTPSETKEGYTTYRRSDAFVSYIDTPTHVFVFTYNLGTELRIEYLQTFEMMINSFHALP